MKRQAGVALPAIMMGISAVGVFLFFLSSAVVQERRDLRRSASGEAAYYAAEAGIESALADLSAGRTVQGWTGENVAAEVKVTRQGTHSAIRSVATVDGQTVTLEVRAERRGKRIDVLSWGRLLTEGSDR